MYGKLNIISLLLFITTWSCCAGAYNKELTFYVEAGKLECFYIKVVKGDQLEIDYQVIDGGHMDFEISFSLVDPKGLIIVSDYKKPENNHHHEAELTGTYRICFDNMFSFMGRKTVFFEVNKYRNDVKTTINDKEWTQEAQIDEIIEMKTREFILYLDSIREKLTTSRHLQDYIRSHEARDRNLAEANFRKVNYWSLLQLFTMFLVGLLQVFMVRSIFETNSPINRFWCKLHL